MFTFMRLISCVALLLALAGEAALAQHDEAGDAPDNRQAELEAKFAQSMSGAQLVGYFTRTGRADDQPLSEDKYTLGEVKKIDGDMWSFEARIQYGQKDVTVPLMLLVKWAGDTPVITLTDFAIPGMGTFTARVLVYRGEYAGTWSAGDHGGQMFGKVTRPESKEQSIGDWPSFRGAFARGYDDSKPLPGSFNVETGENILWKTPVEGLAHSSPVIVGDRLYLTTAVKEGEDELRVGLYGDIQPVQDDSTYEFKVLCLEKRSGEILWSKTAWQGVPAVKRHPKGSHAASTPAADAKHIVAFFGSEGLYCYDPQGELLWSKNFGTLDSGFYMVPDAQWGFASSPVIHENKVLVQCDVQGESFLAALDLNTGDELWRTPRDEVPTWSTPTVHVGKDRTQVICNGWKVIAGYDINTGEQLWSLVGGGDIPVPTPVVAHDLIYITNAHGRMAPIYAIRTSATGTLEMPPDGTSNQHMAWAYARRGAYMQTPLAYGDLVYLCTDAGIVSCFDGVSGEMIYRERVGDGRSGFTASAVAGDGKIYYTSEQGSVQIVRAGREWEKMATSDLGETCMATPAISDGIIYFRARHHVFAVGLPKDGSQSDRSEP
ncbi:MAG: PQQ-binding-like beta-propeller repeat protein [Phycisphaerales bacterium]|nr:PQQ-binding-like beta-propeller repeat protein [Phycisphaerales bacterium]